MVCGAGDCQDPHVAQIVGVGERQCGPQAVDALLEDAQFQTDDGLVRSVGGAVPRRQPRDLSRTAKCSCCSNSSEPLIRRTRASQATARANGRQKAARPNNSMRLYGKTSTGTSGARASTRQITFAGAFCSVCISISRCVILSSTLCFWANSSFMKVRFNRSPLSCWKS